MPGLGAVICEKFAAQGADVAVNYVNNKERANQVAEKCSRQFGVHAITVQSDIGVTEDIARLIAETVKLLGGLDIIINNAGWTRFSTFGDLHALSHDEWNKCWTINVMSQLSLMQYAAPIFNNNPDGGVFIITSSISAITVYGSSMGYCVTKAAGLRLMKCLASTQGPKIRVNAVLPGLLLTEWCLLSFWTTLISSYALYTQKGMQFPEAARKVATERAVLKQEVRLSGPRI
ncbi:uncharacterized protein Z520_10363 [Fonsecaea multimorphosa CBS 102226]|uniref:Uncharacterized protein n=1 Tax=Fonsecaea multimorphosa CBS 102226 TaxID=1442371 RepID=A0A0D2IA47_9EURO|nr:uncharacterized protein Z520_10363 [Fonsecaea multimorphosa CBS 102226]KIX94026.1 hypothetical protein Z520_10363 [Fonsecaea multimorphosa CBS 102226]